MSQAHSHSHAHPHAHPSDTRNIGIVFFINLFFTLIEIVGGLLTNSMAILSDALHDFGDSVSLGIGWYLSRLSEKKPSAQFSYGYRRFSLLAALINSFILVIGSTLILVEAVPRLMDPQMPNAQGMLYLAILGIFVNGMAVIKLRGSNSLNAKVVGYHMLEDVLGWVVVLVVSVVLMFIEWPILDPLLSILFTVYILWNVVKVLNKTVRLFLQAVPDSVNLSELSSKLCGCHGVESCHDTHLWSLDGEHHILSTHLVTLADFSEQRRQLLRTEIKQLMDEYQIHQSTIEFEFPEDDCRLTSHQQY